MNTNNVRDLLRVNANPKPLDSALQAQLFDAVRVGDCPRIVVLIEEGADPNAIGLKGFNALHLACHAKDEATAGQLITTLVERGANINVPCTRGGTPQTHLKESCLGLDATRRLLKLTERLGANDFLTGLACMTVDPVRIRLGKGTGDGLWIGVDAQWSDDRDTLANYTAEDVNNYHAADITLSDDGCLTALHRQSTASGIDFRTGFTLRVPQAFVEPLRAALKAASGA